MKNAYFAGGCFWCITPTFEAMEGVIDTVSGYSGGNIENPTYEQVKSQQTGHRETIKIIYDETKLSFEQLFEIFLNNVDPFDGGGQFIDRGLSYTLAVYYNDETEKMLTEKMISAFEKEAGQQVFIAVEPFEAFYDAEEYHQKYYLKNPEAFEKELIESGRK